MTKPAVEAVGLAKWYPRGAKPTGLRDWLRQLTREGPRPPRDGFWALTDVSLAVSPGDVLGLVGHNGAGKSTLLKILSGVTRPTRGEATLRGRVASLLEVGTGFHPELSGRENVFLSGVLLGMSRRDIRLRFDRIVAFSGVEAFLDTPVKRYSCGMFVRLAFAVMAHLEGEILLLDEVLAVGDAAFQKQCLGKVGELAKSGRAVVYVSHQLASLVQWCNRLAWLDHGALKAEGDPRAVLSAYLPAADGAGERVWPAEAAPTTGGVTLLAVRAVQSGRTTATVSNAEPLAVEIDYRVATAGEVLLGIQVHEAAGEALFTAANIASLRTSDDALGGGSHPPGRYRAVCGLPDRLLMAGAYHLTIVAQRLGELPLSVDGALSFTVRDDTAVVAEYRFPLPGRTLRVADWRTQPLETA